MIPVTGFWEFLSRDIAFLGGPHSPMLSWLGSCGMVFFFVWHVLKMKKEIAGVRRAFGRVHPMLKGLAKERRDIDRERLIPHAGKVHPGQTGQMPSSPVRIDCDDLQTVDAGMQQEPMLRDPWAQYRMTLILEQVPWFMEPRIFGTRRAAEVFSQEALILHRVNLAFYHQVPSLITGIGLLLTFLALFIGLGKLHAEGSEIVGIQGLINGLAGKFLTSIVGLILANTFTFLEKPLVSRLMNAHHTFLDLMDQLFPRKTIEQLLEQLTGMQREPPNNQATSNGELREHGSGWDKNAIVGPTDDLTARIQSLRTWQQNEHLQIQRLMTELPRVLQEESHAPMTELTDAIHGLTRLLNDSYSYSRPMETSGENRPLLWKTSPYPRASPEINFLEKIGSWSRRPWFFRQRRTG